jgi:hypothetical protein
MILTSYFANYRKFPKGIHAVSIARFPPKGSIYPRYDDLIPSLELLNGYKNGTISENQYVEKYNEQLSKLNPNKVGKELDGTILLCYEKSGKFCHRNLVSDWLKKSDIEIKELD